MSESNLMLPRLIEGGLVVDDRGQVMFVNDFHFEGVKRFYVVSNHSSGFVRAWHAHRHETKYVLVALGAAIVGAVAIDDWKQPNRNAHVHRYVISAERPSVLSIPAGYANGFMSLTEHTQLVFFSTTTMKEAQKDDVRYDARYWDIWDVVER